MKKIVSMLFGIILLLIPFTQDKVMASDTGLKEVAPKLIIESYEVSDGQLIPGEEFTLKLTIKNTNPYVEAQNIMLSYSASNLAVYPVFGESNQYFVDSILGGEESEIELHMVVAESVKDSLASITVQLEYSSKNSNNTESSSGIILPISKSCNIKVDTLSVAQSCTIGSKSLVSIAYSNTGLADIKNVKMFLNGDILEEQKEISLGDLACGAQISKDYYVNFQHEGEQILGISFSYEDSNGVNYTIAETTFTTTVNPAVDTYVGTNLIVEQDNTLFGRIEGWQIAAMIIGVIVIIGIFLVIMKTKRRH